MKIYTRSGDAGKTGVIGGRLDKDHVRVDAYGTIDELNSFLGLAITALSPERDADLLADLAQIQQDLFDCCSDLATVDPTLRPYAVSADRAEALEPCIDRYDEETEDLEHFIVPGGTPASAWLHVCRTIARRAERRVVLLEKDTTPVNSEVKRYLNRLSDLLFTLARVCNARANVPDVQYLRSKKVFRRK